MKKYGILVVLLFAFVFAQCSVYKTLVNLSRVQFRLAGVDNVYVEGISVKNKTKISDFSVLDILPLTRAVGKGSLNVSLVLNVEAVNPNNGKGGYPATNAKITSMPYRLVIDDKEFITGNILSPFEVPGTGEKVVIPLAINMDVMKTIKDKGYENALNLVLKLVGLGKGNANIVLYARPVMGTAYGNVNYPQEIKIISASFN